MTEQGENAEHWHRGWRITLTEMGTPVTHSLDKLLWRCLVEFQAVFCLVGDKCEVLIVKSEP